MRYKVKPEDFQVEELIQLSVSKGGRYSIYRVEKRNATTMAVRARMARALGKSHSDVIVPAFKDKDAVAIQHVAVRGGGPRSLSGDGFEAERLGYSERPLKPTDLLGNRFTLILRDLSDQEADHIQTRRAELAEFGLPNYFDQQRFGSLPKSPEDDHIAKKILQRDEEGAVHAYLAEEFIGDPGHVRRFKAFAAEHWEEWPIVFEAAPSPSNFRSVLTYLRDHPTKGSDSASTDFRKALNLINRRLLSIYLSAYQSLLWNRVAGRFLADQLPDVPSQVEIARETLPLYHTLPPDIDREMEIPRPYHRAKFGTGTLGQIARDVIAEEGFVKNDLKPRILDKAYFSRGKRMLLLFPPEIATATPQPDERFAGRLKLELTFELPRGTYATLVLKALTL